jgi:hypothetical protein
VQHRRLIAPLAVLLAAGAVAPAAISARTATHLFNTRYCEVFELKGLPPDARVTVWNTIGFSHCPPAQWAQLDPPAIAKARGDTAVILNGPRYWLLDTATGKSGRATTIAGMRFRRVAAIAIKTAGDLVRTPYSERTIERNNTWIWGAGRTVYELVAPGGIRYVMQSYSHTKDRSLTLRDLRTLGSRLSLPDGWTYRHRKLRHALRLVAHGSATIIQDDLENTYQRESGAGTAIAPGHRRMS